MKQEIIYVCRMCKRRETIEADVPDSEFKIEPIVSLVYCSKQCEANYISRLLICGDTHRYLPTSSLPA